ncbi:hypothetical protein WL1483_1655 [Aeromonas schubertii]|uniref:Uncharacterized protein n=1 Tax=Aeromonas schubertii TaxID=652 RepID=A0A0S2SHD5_9GAMM|nr:hypothetical protein WL1483_1655 [Aeromonas schubertii]
MSGSLELVQILLKRFDDSSANEMMLLKPSLLG